MEKKSTISYKIYSNERLKPVLFHGKEIHPLYIQVIYERKPVYFKSYFFDLLSQNKYALDWIAGRKIPSEKQIIKKEEHLLNFLTERQNNEFSFESFQKDYYYYGNDLLHKMDEDFKDYMYTFFNDVGQPELAILIDASRTKIMSAKLVDGFKSFLKPELFKKLLENATYYGPPYLPLYDFAQKIVKEKVPTFSVFQWQLYQNDLQLFFSQEYSQYSVKDLESSIIS